MFLVWSHQNEVDHIQPAEYSVDDHPEKRMQVAVGNYHRHRRAETNAVRNCVLLHTLSLLFMNSSWLYIFNSVAP